TGTTDGEPTRAGVPVSDIFTGVYSVIGILAALQRRERTGKGGYVDTALVDSTVGVLANQAMNYLASGVPPKRIGNAHPNIVPYQVLPAAEDRKSTRLNSSHLGISYAVFCLKKTKQLRATDRARSILP